jgi:hypothetical protein
MVVNGQTLTKYLKTDRSFDNAKLTASTLALQAGMNAIRFAVFEGQENRCIALGDLRNNMTAVSAGLDEQVRSFGSFLEGACETVPWLCMQFRKTWLAWEGMNSTLVPCEMMVPNERWEYLSFGHRIEPGETVLSDRLTVPDAFNIYSVPEKVRELFTAKFGPVSLYHYSTPFLAGAIADHGRQQGKPVLYAYLSELFIDLAFIDRSGLKFHNRFSYSAPEDAIYYMIYVLQQFSMDPEQTKVLLTGQISAGDRLFTLLGKYVGNPVIPLSVHEVHPCKDLEDAPLHEWFPLLNLFRCAS